jgi:ankyrin repeat protein
MKQIILKSVIFLITAAIIACTHQPPTADDDLVTGILLGDLPAVQGALDRGADVNRADQDGMTPLMRACKVYSAMHAEAGAEVKIEAKADLDKAETSVNAQIPEAHATRSAKTIRGNPGIVQLLLARGADVNAADKKGQTALSLATQNNLPEIIELLRKAGAKK